MKTLQLNETTYIPVLGFGTWQLKGKIAEDSVEKALKVGYRHIDTADAYGNHQEVAKAIKNSQIKREDLFITTKVWHANLAKEAVAESGQRFLDELQTDYIDLLLIHWPNNTVDITETLQAMNALKSRGVTRAIGVSNFTIKHLKKALETGVEITNNQIEIHPSFSQSELRSFCQENNITVTSYSPIAQGQDLKLPAIENIAKKHQTSSSQVILNWIIQSGMIAIPRSENPNHIIDNFQTLEWTLSDEEIAEIDKLNTNNRMVNPGFSEFNS